MFDKMINSVMANAEKAIPVNEGDYQQDGLWYCGKCNTPKQVRIEIFGSVKTPMCLCKCQSEQAEREAQEEKDRIHMLELERLNKVGMPEREMRTWTFENDDGQNEHISNVARRYVENFQKCKADHRGLLFFGTVGTGKTYISACIANALMAKGIPCLVTNFSRLVNTIQSMREGKQEYLDSLNDYDLLVIDDLSSERDTEFMNEIVMNVIDSRYRSGLPLIITTNITADELKNPSDIRKERIYSRLMQMCFPIEVSGKDRRKSILRQDFGEYKDLLGI